jgi:uncharacterized protein (DUF1778 family)
MQTATTAPRADRVDIRVSSETKALIARAASYSGLSVSSFVVKAAAEQAKALVAEHENLTLSARDWSAFTAALDRADKPRPKLAAAAKRYLRRRADAR